MPKELCSKDVIHDKDSATFYIQVQSGKKAFLNYETSKGSVDLWHTEVPEECRGQGIAGVLAENSIKELAKAFPSCKIILSCTYLQHYYKKHPDKFTHLPNKIEI